MQKQVVKIVSPWAGQLPLPTRAITIRQGYAWAVAAGWKPIENRTWSINHRGPLVIHASSNGRDLDSSADFLESACPEVVPIFDDPLADDDHGIWQLEALIGVVNVVDCIEYNPRSRADRDRLLARCRELGVKSASKRGGDNAILACAEGPFCWLVRDALEFSHAIYAGGKLNLWNMSAEQKQAVALAIPEALKRHGKRPALQAPVWVHPQSAIAAERRRASRQKV